MILACFNGKPAETARTIIEEWGDPDGYRVIAPVAMQVLTSMQAHHELLLPHMTDAAQSLTKALGAGDAWVRQFNNLLDVADRQRTTDRLDIAQLKAACERLEIKI